MQRILGPFPLDFDKIAGYTVTALGGESPTNAPSVAAAPLSRHGLD